MVIFKNNATKEEKLEVRFAHQDYGVKLARKILNEVNYPVELIEEILEIISQHDTRDGFISQNEGITRDADKLYRFSKVGFIQALTRYDYTFEELYNKETSRIKLPGFIFSESAKHIAKDELETRKKEYH
jgi:hypothetical protein